MALTAAAGSSDLVPRAQRGLGHCYPELSLALTEYPLRQEVGRLAVALPGTRAGHAVAREVSVDDLAAASARLAECGVGAKRARFAVEYCVLPGEQGGPFLPVVVHEPSRQ